MAKKPRVPRGFRDVDGILLLNKPQGLSSNKALQKARNLFKAKKAGHTGSLDPLAVGMLPLCFGEATKFSSFLLDSSKRYRAVCQLGISSTTGDAEGELSQKKPVNASLPDIELSVNSFLGKSLQVPPMHSAVKHDGKRLYELARQGKIVERSSREIEIYQIAVSGYAAGLDQVTIDVHSSKGTYIRTLVEDIGNALGCGAYITHLQRTGVEPFWQLPMFDFATLQQLQESEQLDSALLPVDQAIIDWQKVNLDETAVYYLKRGQPVQVPGSPANGRIRFYDQHDDFLGVGYVQSDGKLAPKRLLRTA